MKYIVFLFLIFCFFNCSNKHFLKKGVFNIHHYFINYDSTKPMPLPINHKVDSIWYNDSCVIIVRNVITSRSDFTSQGEIVSNSYNFMCYTYINMQTKQSQDYLNFSDTAQPVSNFFVDYHSFGNGNLLAEKRDSDWKGNISWLPDTVENNIRYKRLHMINKYKDGPAEFIYYLDCKSPKTVFHLSRAVDEKYPQCQAVKFINWSHTSFVNSGKPLIWVHEINLVNKKLSQKKLKYLSNGKEIHSLQSCQ